MKIFICALILISNVAFCGEKLNSLLEQLDDDDFDVREAATSKLSTFPAEYAKKFLKLSYTSNLEVRQRLFTAAKEIFYNSLMTKDNKYKLMFGLFGFDYTDYYTEPDKETEHALPRHFAVVNFVYFAECADGILEKYDVICEVNGIPWLQFITKEDSDYGDVIPGQKYVLSIRRCVDINAINERGCVLDTDRYVTKEVTITAGKKAQERVNKDVWDRFKKLSDGKWESFFIDTKREFKKELGMSCDDE